MTQLEGLLPYLLIPSLVRRALLPDVDVVRRIF